MSIRRTLPSLLVALCLASAACGESNATKTSPRDAVGMGEAEGAAAGTGVSGEGLQEGTSNQPGAPANDTVPHRPEASNP